MLAAPIMTPLLSRMGEMLTGVADRPAALSAFLRSLPADDRAQLRRLLKGKDAES